ncbi:dTDP-4-dehydrorhamnose reductase [Rhizobium azibense]|nr:dTDP-4-dehydrorhamnose reductase [Rhizobium azibense]
MVRRYIVTGRDGQVARSLMERASGKSDLNILPLGRPEFDLAVPEKIAAAIEAARPDLIISLAAYTAVDKAESEEAQAFIVNGQSPGIIAATASQLGVPLVHLSTDYVFDGEKTSPYVETDTVAPLSVYGRSKLAGEKAIAAATADYAILRTAWVYSPFGQNFVRTMLRLADTRNGVNVVADQIGNPTSAFDIAEGILAVAENLLHSDSADLRGIFHMTAAGVASWADFATEIFRQSAQHGGPSALVNRITTEEYPTPARRPKNSRLDCRKLSDFHGVALPTWEGSAELVVRSLLAG